MKNEVSEEVMSATGDFPLSLAQIIEAALTDRPVDSGPVPSWVDGFEGDPDTLLPHVDDVAYHADLLFCSKSEAFESGRYVGGWQPPVGGVVNGAPPRERSGLLALVSDHLAMFDGVDVDAVAFPDEIHPWTHLPDKERVLAYNVEQLQVWVASVSAMLTQALRQAESPPETVSERDETVARHARAMRALSDEEKPLDAWETLWPRADPWMLSAAEVKALEPESLHLWIAAIGYLIEPRAIGPAR
jgi:hypothetical protein